MQKSYIEVMNRSFAEAVNNMDEALTETILKKHNTAIAKFLKQRLEKGEEPRLVLPHIIFEVLERAGGDGGNINIGAKFTKTFIESLNDEKVAVTGDDTPDEFLEIFYDLLFNEPPQIAVTMQYTAWINEYIPKTISDLARANSKEGMDYTIEDDNGSYIFTMKDGEISARFTASKLFKQTFKDDQAVA